MKNIKAKSFGDFINESESINDKAELLASKIKDAINEVDDSLSYEDLAKAIAIVLNDSYGSHNTVPFLDVLTDNVDGGDINEAEQKVVYNTNFTGMVQGAVGSIHSQVMAIAKSMADEKEARNPHRYKVADKTSGVEEVDITRALNLIFHSDWKNMIKGHHVHQWAKSCIDRATKHDERSNKKNQRAIRTQSGQQLDNYKVDLGTQGHSRDLGH